ncbi:YqfQ family protein [Neobacillus pocheonensis]|uniref:YqfQ family protein n=1 Tax=Neobacillus pocheonensis TaxID=363869 RepID=A0ABT0W5J5_9BACI|nr:YqfQ family protein [Neobacillus pocheonensis]
MQPRPRIPMQGGMGPQMMGRSPFGGGNPMMGPGSNPFGGRNPLMGQMMGRPQQMSRGGGGLLSKILGRGNQAAGVRGLGGIQGAGRAATGGGGGLLQSLSNPSGISSMLNNTQQVLKTAQSFAR